MEKYVREIAFILCQFDFLFCQIRFYFCYIEFEIHQFDFACAESIWKRKSLRMLIILIFFTYWPIEGPSHYISHMLFRQGDLSLFQGRSSPWHNNFLAVGRLEPPPTKVGGELSRALCQWATVASRIILDFWRISQMKLRFFCDDFPKI